MGLRCAKFGETPLLKAVRSNQIEMAYSIIHMVIEQVVPYEACNIKDKATGRNILHWAVINKQRDLIEVIVKKIDADKGELRGMKDAKHKTP